MNKLQRLKKKVIRRSIFCAVAVLFCLALAGASGFYSSTLEEKVMQLSMQRTSMNANNTQILQRYEEGKKTAATYEQINPAHAPLFGTLDRKTASVLLETLNHKYNLRSLSLDISPAALQANPPYQRKTGGINTSTVRIAFESVTDEYAYSVMRDIIASFPGFLRVSSVNLTKNHFIDDQILYDVQSGEIPPKVKSEFAFDWLGMEIKNNETTTPPPAAP